MARGRLRLHDLPGFSDPIADGCAEDWVRVLLMADHDDHAGGGHARGHDGHSHGVSADADRGSSRSRSG